MQVNNTAGCVIKGLQRHKVNNPSLSAGLFAPSCSVENQLRCAPLQRQQLIALRNDIPSTVPSCLSVFKKQKPRWLFNCGKVDYFTGQTKSAACSRIGVEHSHRPVGYIAATTATTVWGWECRHKTMSLEAGSSTFTRSSLQLLVSFSTMIWVSMDSITTHSYTKHTALKNTIWVSS